MKPATSSTVCTAPDQIALAPGYLAREGIASYWLARRLPELLQLEPDVRLFIKVLPRTPNLAEGDGDIAIQFEKPTAANIVSRQLGWLHYILYAAPSYLAAHGTPRIVMNIAGIGTAKRIIGKDGQPGGTGENEDITNWN